VRAGGKTKQGPTELVEKMNGREGEKWTQFSARLPPPSSELQPMGGLITYSHGSGDSLIVAKKLSPLSICRGEK